MLFRSVAEARVDVVSDSRLGIHTTTLDDGTYEFAAVVPGHIVIHTMKNGFVATDLPLQIHPGDNRLSVVLFAETDDWGAGPVIRLGPQAAAKG